MFSFRSLTVDDIDALWGWVKDDPDVVNWWGLGVASSLDFLVGILKLVLLEQQGAAALRVVEEEGTLVGFVGAFPILPDRSAFVHVVIAPERRGHGKELLKQAIAEAHALGLGPLTAVFAIEDAGLYRLAKSLGFKEEAKYLVLRKN